MSHRGRNSMEFYQPPRRPDEDLSDAMGGMRLEDGGYNVGRGRGQHMWARGDQRPRGHQRPDNYDLRSELNNHEEARGLQRSQSDVGGSDLRHKLNRDRRNDRRQDDARHDDRKQDDARHDDRRHDRGNDERRNERGNDERRNDRGNDERRNDRGNEDKRYDERGNDTRRSDDGRNNRRRDDRRGDRRQRNGDQGQNNRGQQHMGGGKLARPKKNTENFSPCHEPPPMRVIVATPGLARYDRAHSTRDVIIVSDLFGNNPGDLGIYNKLIREIQASGVPEEQLWKLWHGDSHLIADDKRHWKELCPTFTYVVDRMRDYFDMDIKATRFNWYRNTSEWKPFHHDAAAMKPDKARTQNFTVAVSFGCEREAAFEHAETETVVSMPQPNGTIYTFGRDVNIIWRHGILQVAPDQHREEGRVSIIAWGWVPQTEL